MEKPIGIYLLLWPTFWALWIAAEGIPQWHYLVVFTLGVGGRLPLRSLSYDEGTLTRAYCKTWIRDTGGNTDVGPLMVNKRCSHWDMNVPTMYAHHFTKLLKTRIEMDECADLSGIPKCARFINRTAYITCKTACDVPDMCQDCGKVVRLSDPHP